MTLHQIADAVILIAQGTMLAFLIPYRAFPSTLA
jgi:hypothetical protein